MTPISTTRHTTMEVLPCYLRREGDDPLVASPYECVGVSSACPLFVATDPCLPPEGTTMTWAHVGVPHHRSAEVEEAGAEHVTCLFHHHHHQEGEEGSNLWLVWAGGSVDRSCGTWGRITCSNSRHACLSKYIWNLSVFVSLFVGETGLHMAATTAAWTTGQGE